MGFVVTRPTDSVPENASVPDAGTAVQHFSLSPENDSTGGYWTVELQFGMEDSAFPTGAALEDVALYHYTDGE